MKKFDRKDVEKFLREMDTLKVFRIVEGPVEKESESGYKDEWWTIETDQFGFEEPLTFHVINYHSYGKFGVSNRLISDFKGSIHTRLFDTYNNTSNLRIEKREEYINEGYSLSFPISHREGFQKILPEVENIQKHIRKYRNLEDFQIYIPFQFVKDSISSSFLEEESLGNVVFNQTTLIQELKDALTKVDIYDYKCGSEYQYLVYCLEYGLWDRIGEFTDVEVEHLIKTCTKDLVEVRDVNQHILKKNIVYGKDKDLIAYGNLYHLLPQERIEGTFDDYNYVDESGNTYSFSYKEGSPFIGIEEASKLLGVEVDDGIPIVYTYIPNDYFAYFNMDENSFEKDWLNQYPDYYRYCEKDADGLMIYGKPYELTRLTRGNDKRIDEIRQDLREKYGSQIYISNLGKVYEGVTFTFPEGTYLEEKDFEKVKEVARLTALNQLLKIYDKKEAWGLSITIEYKKDNEVKAKKEYHLPEDNLDYSWFQKQ